MSLKYVMIYVILMEKLEEKRRDMK